jgi:amicoumacin kinase
MDISLLSKGTARFDSDVSQLRLLGGFSNNVFECKRPDGNFILKFYPSQEYKEDSIREELNWIQFLHQSGVQVTPPLHSVDGNLIEMIQDVNDVEFYVLAFEKAKGTFVNVLDKECWNKEFFYYWGKTLGKIHSISKKYVPGIGRKEWNQGVLFKETSEVVLEKWGNFIKELEQLSKENDSYGMIHNDLHHKNFYINNNELVLFDFGDCEYNWFVYDIAIVLYHAVQTVDEKDVQGRNDFAFLFIQSFLEGYLTENHLEQYWLTKLPFFLNYRQIFSYMYFNRFLN